MRLRITQHAISRMGVSNFTVLPLIPRDAATPLQPNIAYRLWKLVRILLKSLDEGTPVRMTDHVQAAKYRKYRSVDVYIYNERDHLMHTLVVRGDDLALVTITNMAYLTHSNVGVKDSHPVVRMEQVTAITIPYTVVPGGEDKRFLTLKRAWGPVPVYFGPPPAAAVPAAPIQDKETAP